MSGCKEEEVVSKEIEIKVETQKIKRGEGVEEVEEVEDEKREEKNSVLHCYEQY